MTRMSKKKVTVLVVDDHEMVREGLLTFLELHDGIEVVGEASNGREAIEQTQQLSPDVVLMDLVMPEMDGIVATKQIRDLSPNTKIIALTSFGEDDKVMAAVRAGAAGYLLKNVSPPDLVRAIEDVHRGEAHLQPEIAKKLMGQFVDQSRNFGPSELTERELQVLGLIANGLSNREIATALRIAEKTVKVHVGNILNKLGLADRTQAAIYAIKKGLVPDERGDW